MYSLDGNDQCYHYTSGAIGNCSFELLLLKVGRLVAYIIHSAGADGGSLRCGKRQAPAMTERAPTNRTNLTSALGKWQPLGQREARQGVSSTSFPPSPSLFPLPSALLLALAPPPPPPLPLHKTTRCLARRSMPRLAADGRHRESLPLSVPSLRLWRVQSRSRIEKSTSLRAAWVAALESPLLVAAYRRRRLVKRAMRRPPCTICCNVVSLPRRSKSWTCTTPLQSRVFVISTRT